MCAIESIGPDEKIMSTALPSKILHKKPDDYSVRSGIKSLHNGQLGAKAKQLFFGDGTLVEVGGAVVDDVQLGRDTRLPDLRDLPMFICPTVCFLCPLNSS